MMASPHSDTNCVLLLPLWPSVASSAAGAVDRLFIFLLALCGTVTLGIFLTILYFVVKYRRRSDDETPRPRSSPLWMELTWTFATLAIFLFIFGWGVKVYFDLYSPEAGALQVYVVGKQWMWQIQHPDGQREINNLHVPLNRRVQLILGSEDVIHSFYVPAFRIKRDAVPGMYTSVQFRPTRVGEYHLFCAEYCGTEHSFMIGSVTVLAPKDYERWLAGAPRGESLAAAGARLYVQLGCANCHGNIAPSLNGLYLKSVGLADGRVVVANEQYLRESILDPGAKIVGGFPNIMPSFRGIVDEVGLQALVEYIKSLGAPAAGYAGQGGPRVGPVTRP
jgi:cytochrome c oxidase subunit 2